MELVKCF